MSEGLVAWLRRQLAEDELWALAASASYHNYSGESFTVPGGVHWIWAVGENWTPVEVDPTCSYVGEPDDTCNVSLVTVEEFPLSFGGTLAGRVCQAEEMRIGDAGHIIRHDPARVLRDVAAHRRILERHVPIEVFGQMLCTYCGVIKGASRPDASWPCPDLRNIAAIYADRPGYRESWRPT